MVGSVRTRSTSSPPARSRPAYGNSPSGRARIADRAAISSTLLDVEDISQLQRTAGNRAVVTALADAVPIQRTVMTAKRWHEQSSKFGRRRGIDLLAIDQALAAYHAVADGPEEDRLDTLDTLKVAIQTWQAGKSLKAMKKGAFTPLRDAAVKDLYSSVDAELKTLKASIAKRPKSDTGAGVRATSHRLAKLAQSRAKDVLATPPPRTSMDALQQDPSSGGSALDKVRSDDWLARLDHTKQLIADAIQLRHDADTATGGQASEDDHGAEALAHATYHLVKATRAISYLHLKRLDNHKRKGGGSRLQQQRDRLMGSKTRIAYHRDVAENLDDTVAPNVIDDATRIDRMLQTIGLYEAFVPNSKPGPGSTDVFEGAMDAVGTITGMTGYQGTGGKGNEGLEEFHRSKNARTGEKDETTDAVRAAFSRWDPGSQSHDALAADLLAQAEEAQKAGDKDEAQALVKASQASAALSAAPRDVMSGVSDMIGAGAAGAQDLIGFGKALRTLKDPDADHDAKMDAAFAMASGPFSALSTVMKFTGGFLTALRGGGVDLADSATFSTTTKTDSGLEVSSGVDVSTDVKMAGDFAGLFAGVINTIKQVIHVVKYIKEGGGSSAKEQKRTTRKDLEGVGNLLHKYTGAVTSLAGNHSAVTKLAFQIKDGGQIADSSAGSIASLGGAVPALGLIKSVIDAIKHAYKLFRIGLRRTGLTEQLRGMRDKAEVRQIEAVELVRETLVKRTDRVGINLGHALAGILAGGLNLSGIGIAPGMVVNLSSTAMKLGQVGLREGKQALRERKAKARAEKDVERGKRETFAEWKTRKRLEAAKKGWFRQYLAEIDIAATRDWDKTAVDKETRYRRGAAELLEMDDVGIWKALGVKDDLAATTDQGKRLKLVITALKKRD